MKVLVIGSAHLDIIAEATAGAGTVDRPGRLRIHAGGTAYNLAINLANLGAKVTFMSAFNDSAISAMLIDELESQGVIVEPVVDTSLPDSGFSAHIDKGEITSAVSSMAVERHRFGRTDVCEYIAKHSWVALDANLSAESLASIIAEAKEQGKPCSLQLVSEEKSLKLGKVPAPDLALCNFREHRHLMSSLGGASTTGIVIVTNGPGPAIAYNGLAVEASSTPDQVDDIVNTLGAGDAFAAGVIIHCAKHGLADIESAMDVGHATAAEILTRSNCNLGKHDVLNQRMSDLARRANRDQLTGALNRHGGEAALGQLVSGGVRFAAMMVDIDHFKEINDTHGHDVGDDVIRAVAGRIKDCLRDQDFLIRWGGEEFLLLVPGIDEETSSKIGQRILDRIRKHHDPKAGRATVSVGSAMHYPGSDGRRTIKAADDALYQAKRSGRDRLVVAHQSGLIEKQSASV